MKPTITENDYAVYLYGSRVYGNAQLHSDWDYVVVREGVEKGDIRQGMVNVKLVSPGHFQRLLDEHRMTALECLFLPPEKTLKAPTTPWRFKLDKAQLFETVSARSDQDWAKAVKRFNSSFDRATELERGKKSLYHSIRLLMFGIQIAKHSSIVDYGEANPIFEEIMTNPSTSWEDYKTEWKPKREKLLEELRSVA